MPLTTTNLLVDLSIQIAQLKNQSSLLFGESLSTTYSILKSKIEQLKSEQQSIIEHVFYKGTLSNVDDALNQLCNDLPAKIILEDSAKIALLLSNTSIFNLFLPFTSSVKLTNNGIDGKTLLKMELAWRQFSNMPFPNITIEPFFIENNAAIKLPFSKIFDIHQSGLARATPLSNDTTQSTEVSNHVYLLSIRSTNLIKLHNENPLELKQWSVKIQKILSDLMRCNIRTYIPVDFYSAVKKGSALNETISAIQSIKQQIASKHYFPSELTMHITKHCERKEDGIKQVRLSIANSNGYLVAGRIIEINTWITELTVKNIINDLVFDLTLDDVREEMEIFQISRNESPPCFYTSNGWNKITQSKISDNDFYYH